MSDRITVVLSKHRSPTSQQTKLETQWLERVNTLRGLEVLVVHHLYDLAPNGPTFETLRAIDNELIVLAWLYPRATYWILWAHGVRGRSQQNAERNRDDFPDRMISCFDLNTHDQITHDLHEIERIVSKSGITEQAGSPYPHVREIDEKTRPRWYPVIDFDRCDHCLECLNFCLFGVYGVGVNTSVLIEQPQACRPGCPACSRICPKGAILFPRHQDPAVAGDPEASHEGLKLSLSQFFGGPNPKEMAEAERQKFLAEKDDLDQLVDDIDSMETS